MSSGSKKYIVLVLDGSSDFPIPELGGKTPLQVARKSNIDNLARESLVGLVRTVPEGMEPGSDVANLSIFGYDPRIYFTGRGPFEAASMGIELKEGEIAFRCNLVTIKDGLMFDYSAGHIENDEARELIEFLQEKLSDSSMRFQPGFEYRFYPGLSYRHLMVTSKASLASAKTTPPHDVTGQPFEKYLPEGEGLGVLKDLIFQSIRILERHPINLNRVDSGKNPANSIWLWGQGTPPSLTTYSERFGISGGVISAVDLIKGIGKVAGLQIINVPGATGYFDTDYEAKARYGLDCLVHNDFVYIHVEAPDEAGHIGDLEKKVCAIEDIDSRLLSILLDGLFSMEEDFDILILPDHATPLSLKTHVGDPVPFLIYRSWDEGRGTRDGGGGFDEVEAASTGLFIENGFDLMDFFITHPSSYDFDIIK